MKKLIIPILVAAFAAVVALPVVAADAPKPAEKKDAPARPLPLRGKIDSIDKQAKTFKINERTFHVTAETRIIKDGKPGTFDDAAAGQDVTGSYREGTDKKLNVVTLRIGGRPAAPAK
jgi:opacity protein-like surface antigen